MNKTHILAALLCLLAASARGQFSDRVFKPFKIIASMGYARPQNIPHLYPLDFQLEPKYGFTDNLWLGVRLETTLFVQKALLSEDYQARAVFSIVPTLDYSFLATDEFRPFVSLGMGHYTTRLYYDGYEANQGVSEAVVSNWGFCPRVGMEYKRFCLSLEHNFVRGGVSFSALKAGFTLGGGTVD